MATVHTFPLSQREQAPVAFMDAGRLSLHVETIAQELFAASLTAAGVPQTDWRLASSATQLVFREAASIAILRLQSAPNAIAMAHVRMFHGGDAGEAAVETYHRELVKHAPITGGL